MYSNPIVFSPGKNAVQLKRVPIDSQFEDEKWLQQRLFDAPQSIPFGEIDPGYHQVVPLCMEMSTGAGPIDIVYITPQGRLIIVETKLFRNPEARRKVVAQILDYAKELLSWTYADLQREVSRRNKLKGNSPYLLVRDNFPETEEAAFVDGVTKSLAHGDFMLIIAGDGIRSGAKAIVDFLEQTAHMRFILSMVEVAIYKFPQEEQYYIQPRVLVKTDVVERPYYDADMTQPRVEGRNNVNSNPQQGSEYEEYWTAFLTQLVLDDPEQPLANLLPKGNIFFSLPPSGKLAWINVYFSKKNQRVGCYVKVADLQIANYKSGVDIFNELFEMSDEINRELPFDVEWDEQERTVKRVLGVDERPPLSNPDVMKFHSDTVNAMVNVFRPRLSAISAID